MSTSPHFIARARVAILLGISVICLLAVGAISLITAITAITVNAADAASLSQKEKKGKKEKAIMSMTITSSSFAHQGLIPTRHTCQGHDTSPELLWTEVPDGTKSLVLIMDDPDAPDPAAPKRTWVHWVLYNIPATATGLAEAIPAAELPSGTREGRNDWERTGYGGPCPPVGSHRYFHKLYALDTILPDLKQPTKAKLEEAMEGHVIGYSELIGLFQKH
jgi:Raf kinase inhibitor-like YbhB/YbcL family protein